ncbi:MAG: PEP-CTERM sorting domain-containing protein [Gemmatimonadetes bacterium]|nr:PEP-CTERM sorting domain-containing protein [Gemmatimonadota bacterium]
MRKIVCATGVALALVAGPVQGQQACVNGVKLSNFTPCTFSGITFSSASFLATPVTPSSLVPTDFRVLFFAQNGYTRLRLEAWLGTGAYVHNTNYPNPVAGTYQNFDLLVSASNATDFSYRMTASLSLAAAAGKQIDSVFAQGLGTGSVFGDMAYAYVNCQTPSSTSCGSASVTNRYGFLANTASGPGALVGSVSASAMADGVNGTRDACSVYAGNYNSWQACGAGSCTYLGASYFGSDRCSLDVVKGGWLGDPWAPMDGVTDGSFFIDSDLSATAGVIFGANGRPSYLSAGGQTDGIYEMRIYTGDYVAPPIDTTVPEPATPVLVASGLALVHLLRRRRR